jgi:hypothetical protein
LKFEAQNTRGKNVPLIDRKLIEKIIPILANPPEFPTAMMNRRRATKSTTKFTTRKEVFEFPPKTLVARKKYTFVIGRPALASRFIKLSGLRKSASPK